MGNSGLRRLRESTRHGRQMGFTSNVPGGGGLFAPDYLNSDAIPDDRLADRSTVRGLKTEKNRRKTRARQPKEKSYLTQLGPRLVSGWRTRETGLLRD